MTILSENGTISFQQLDQNEWSGLKGEIDSLVPLSSPSPELKTRHFLSWTTTPNLTHKDHNKLCHPWKWLYQSKKCQRELTTAEKCRAWVNSRWVKGMGNFKREKLIVCGACYLGHKGEILWKFQHLLCERTIWIWYI